MGLFGDKKKPLGRRPYRKPTSEEIEKRETRKEKEKAREKFYDLAKENPELEKQWVSKQMGIEIKPPDLVEQKKREIKSRLYDRALKNIEEHPELAEQYDEQVLSEIIGSSRKRSGRDDSGYEGYGSPLEEVLGEVENLEQLRERLGGKEAKGMLTDLLNTETFKGIGEALVAKLLAGSGISQAPPQRVFVVQNENGQTIGLTEEEYQRYNQKGLLRPIAALESPKPSPGAQPLPEEEQYTAETPTQELSPELPDFISMIDLDQILACMEQSPEDFVAQLEYEIETGAEMYKYIRDILSATTYDNIASTIGPYRDNAQVGYVVQKILENREWMEKSISLIKGQVDE